MPSSGRIGIRFTGHRMVSKAQPAANKKLSVLSTVSAIKFYQCAVIASIHLTFNDEHIDDEPVAEFQSTDLDADNIEVYRVTTWHTTDTIIDNGTESTRLAEQHKCSRRADSSANVRRYVHLSQTIC